LAKQKDFNNFLNNIEPSNSTISYISSIQTNLRDYLKSHDKYKTVHVQTFLSGSYAKHTSIRPMLYDGKRDVDIVVETTYTSVADSRAVLSELYDVIIEKSIYSTARLQSYSVSVELNGIEIDIAPIVTDDSGKKCYIGSSEEDLWKLTDPKGHISWSSSINASNNGKYKPLVKMLKWWRRTHCPDRIKYPKGITLEKLIADNLPEGDLNTENHMVATIQNIVAAYKEMYTDQGKIPIIDDPTVEENNLLESYKISDFKAFIEKLSEHLQLINENGTTNDVWRTILGNEFPKEESRSLVEYSFEQRNAIACLSVPYRQRPVWALPRGTAAFINTEVLFSDGHRELIENDGTSIPKGCTLYYRALHGVKQPYHMRWQIVNTGKEAAANTCLRGGFEDSNFGMNVRYETTAYTGKHYVQCFIIKQGSCVAKSKEFIINVQ